VLFALVAVPFSAAKSSSEIPEPPAMAEDASMGSAKKTEGTETAVLAGGCFWGVEAVFERLEGVLDVVSGYSGGDAETASYQLVGTGKTGHAESVEIVFDPAVIGYGTLLQVFFTVAHDPTQLNYQGPDIGTEYRSAIFYADEEQKRIAEEYIRSLDEAKAFPEPIVTQVVPLDRFYPAEDYHQDFLRLHPTHPYIVYWDLPKIRHLEEAFPELLAE
jgi:peptide-methionine (S)-S-oxide reductase